MPTVTITTFEQIIKRHKRLIATILDKKLGKPTSEQFIDHVDSAVHFLGMSPSWNSDREAMEAAHTYLCDAYQLADDDPAKVVLLGKADEYLAELDEVDFLC